MTGFQFIWRILLPGYVLYEVFEMFTLSVRIRLFINSLCIMCKLYMAVYEENDH